MAVAYTISQRSSCMQRKVGALIVDDEGNVISSGFNEVPRESRPCVHEYGKCRRKVIWQDVSERLLENFPELEANTIRLPSFFAVNSRFWTIAARFMPKKMQS